MNDVHGIPKPLELVAAQFGSLSPAEEKFLEAIAIGKEADCSLLDKGDWTMRIRLFGLALCTNPTAIVHVTYRVIFLLGGIIDKEVDLSGANISFPRRLQKCIFNESPLPL
jgi:hypothetical protein